VQAKLIFTLCASSGCNSGLRQVSSTTRREDLGEKTIREPEVRRKALCSLHHLSYIGVRRVMALSPLSLTLLLSSLLGAQGVAVLDSANGTFAEVEDGPCSPRDVWLLPRLCWRRKEGENRAAFIIHERNRTKAEQCSVKEERVPAQ